MNGEGPIWNLPETGRHSPCRVRRPILQVRHHAQVASMVHASFDKEANSIDQLIPNLDYFLHSLGHGDGQLRLVADLIAVLAATYDDARDRNELHRFREICQTHPLHARVLQDPFTRRASEKPRGYAGDAVMLDYIYRPKPLSLSGLGAVLHCATTSTGAARSIRWRRSHLASRLLDGMNRHRELRVLSVASGHLRELDIVGAATHNRNMQIVALDQDGAALEEAVCGYPQFDIQPVNQSIASLFRANLAGPFHLIYSAGLFDYLTDRTAAALIEALVSRLHPEGTMILGSHTPTTDGRGYIEGMMDWRLVYRDENDLMHLAAEAADGRSLQVYRDGPGHIAYAEIGPRQRS